MRFPRSIFHIPACEGSRFESIPGREVSTFESSYGREVFSGFLMKLLNLWGMMRVRLEALVVVLIGNLS